MNLKKLERDYGPIKWAGKKCILGMPISFTTYILTETKLITRKGFLNLQEDEMDLYRVVDKSASYPLSQRIFGCGTITVTSKDIDTPHKILQSIKAPRDVARMLESLVTAQKDLYKVRGRDMYSTLGGPHDECDEVDVDS